MVKSQSEHEKRPECIECDPVRKQKQTEKYQNVGGAATWHDDVDINKQNNIATIKTANKRWNNTLVAVDRKW